MNIQLDKETLTRYVLGELDDAEREEVETTLQNDPEARALVDELRFAAALTAEVLKNDAAPALSEKQRRQIEEEAGGVKSPRRWRFAMLKVAAVLTLVIGGAALILPHYLRAGSGNFSFLAWNKEAVPAQTAAEREARQIMAELPAGYERFFITDINGPVGSAGLRETLDYSDPGVQQRLRELRDNQLVSAMKSAPAPKAEPMPSSESGGPRSVSVSGSLRKRGDMNEVDGGGGYGGAVVGYGGGYGGGGFGGGYSGGGGPFVDMYSSRSIGGVSAGAEQMAGRAINGFPALEADFIDDRSQNYWPGHNTESYDTVVDNPFLDVGQNPLSTFSIDVDTASYANIRRFLTQNTMPPKDAVRIEEMVNYFSYDYAQPDEGEPFSANAYVAACPWAPEHRLARIGLKGWEIPADERPASNLVFLLDVSGSMRPQNKLPLLKQGMKLLTQQLGENDSVAIVVYAGASGLVLPTTSGDNQEAILAAIDRLQSGGSTNGGAGIQLAYDTAVANFIDGGVNRVILATDGDFNVGTTNRGDLTRLIEEKAKSGVFLTILGFGMGNTKDATLEELSNKGNGNYAYIDTINEARKVLCEEMGATLITIAKDVKIQIEFNPAQVRAYRLIGYENRILAAEDFNDDTKDAGEIGAGHTVTALYELIPAGQEIDLPGVDPLKYQRETRLTKESRSGEVFTLKLRYKAPDGDTSKLLSFPVTDRGAEFASAPADYQFAAAVASFGMLLRGSEHKGNATYATVLKLAKAGLGGDRHGYRAEFMNLVRKAQSFQ